MNLFTVLNEYYDGQWSTFPSPTNTIDDYDNIIWVNENPPSKEEINNKIQELQSAEPMRLLRMQRNQLLAETDWMANSDVVMTDEWRAYRQALRDLPANSQPELDNNGNLINVTWPTSPE